MVSLGLFPYFRLQGQMSMVQGEGQSLKAGSPKLESQKVEGIEFESLQSET